MASRSAAEDLFAVGFMASCGFIASLEAPEVLDEVCEVGENKQRESTDCADCVDTDEISLLAGAFDSGPCFETAGLTKASTTVGRGLEDLEAYVLLAPIGLETDFEMMLAAAGGKCVPLADWEGFDGVVSILVSVLVLLLVRGRLFGTYELTARLLGVGSADGVLLDRLRGEVARGAIDGIGGIGGR